MAVPRRLEPPGRGVLAHGGWGAQLGNAWRVRGAETPREAREITRVGWSDLASISPSSQQNPYASEAYLHQLLQKAKAAGARDVHLKVGQPPGARVRGSLVFFRVDKIRPEDTEALARHIIRDPKMLAELSELREYDTSYEVFGVGRFRVNIYRQR